MTATLLSINEHVHWELAGIPADGFVASFQPGDYPVFTVGDGQRVVVSGHPAERGTFERYARATGRPELIDDERFGDIGSRLQRLAELRDELQVGAKTFPSPAELESSLAEEGLAMGVLQDGPRGGRQRVGPRARRHRRRARPRGRRTCASPTRPGTSATPTSESGASRPTGASTTARCSAPSAS